MDNLWAGLTLERKPDHIALAEGVAVGEWTLLHPATRRWANKPRTGWQCRCSCGNERWVNAANLANGFSMSCGHGPLGRSK